MASTEYVQSEPMKSSSKRFSRAARSPSSNLGRSHESEPRLGRYLDDEEYTLHQAVERGEFESLGNLAARRRDIQDAARRILEGNRVRISLHLQSDDLSRLRAIAHARGIPYQTLINSILH